MLALGLIAAAQFAVIMDTSIIGVAFAVQSGTTAYPAVPTDRIMPDPASSKLPNPLEKNHVPSH